MKEIGFIFLILLVGDKWKSDFMASHQDTHWVLVGESIIGQSHIKNNVPCQDHHHYEMINSDWGIAILADGAGSVEYAHKGSAFIVQEAASLFKDLLKREKWANKGNLPPQEIWHNHAKNTLKTLRGKLETYATQEKTESKHMSSTLIVVLFSPLGLLATHIGDGRAGYCNVDKKWKALINPWKGEYANETVFVSSDIWSENEIDQFIRSNVIYEEPYAFTLLSDGCERHSFICNVWDEDQNKYYDPNIPFDKFFNPLVENLKHMHKNKLEPKAMKAKWAKFLTEGNAKLKNEPDDKTMIIGVRVA